MERDPTEQELREALEAFYELGDYGEVAHCPVCGDTLEGLTRGDLSRKALQCRSRRPECPMPALLAEGDTP